MSSTGVPILDTIAALQAALAQAAPSYDDEKNIPKADAPPRYVWVLGSIPTGFARGNNDLVGIDVCRLEVHCWGNDKAEAFTLRSYVLTAMARLVGRPRMKNISTDHRGGEGHANKGWVCILKLELWMPLEEALLPGDPEPGVGTAIATTEKISQLGTAGDGDLSLPTD